MEVASSGFMEEGGEVAASREEEAACGIELEARYDNGTVVENPVRYIDFRVNSQ